MKQDDVTLRLKNFIRNEVMHDPSEDLDESTPLLEWGILDSLAMVSMIAFIEKEFHVKVPSEKVIPENFDNLRRIAAMVVSLTESTQDRKKKAA